MVVIRNFVFHNRKLDVALMKRNFVISHQPWAMFANLVNESKKAK